jgi:hypothetical protein
MSWMSGMLQTSGAGAGGNPGAVSTAAGSNFAGQAKYWAPYGVQATGDLIQGLDAKRAADYNATARQMEARATLQQSAGQEQQQRQKGREALGRQAAAVGQAGIGYGGSAAGVMNQSAVNAELDAQNVRYRGQFTAYGYNTQAQADRYEGNVALTRGALLAGGQLLTGVSNVYMAGTRKPKATDAGTAMDDDLQKRLRMLYGANA